MAKYQPKIAKINLKQSKQSKLPKIAKTVKIVKRAKIAKNGSYHVLIWYQSQEKPIFCQQITKIATICQEIAKIATISQMTFSWCKKEDRMSCGSCHTKYAAWKIHAGVKFSVRLVRFEANRSNSSDFFLLLFFNFFHSRVITSSIFTFTKKFF